jgi:hypothetical protein
LELTEGKHYWEVELLSEFQGEIVDIGCYLFWTLICIGSSSRPNLDPAGWHCSLDCTDGWFMCADDGTLCDNGRAVAVGDGAAGRFKEGDRVGAHLDLGGGSLRSFQLPRMARSTAQATQQAAW